MAITKTHQDFKTVDPDVFDAETMEDYVGHALGYQYMFDRRTTPWEKHQWDDKELQNLMIDLEKVDRLYYIYHYDDGVSGQDFRMAARMEHNDQQLYIELCASCDFTGFDCQGQGVIFVSSDANLFMKLVLTKECQTNLIYQSLAEDGIVTEEQTEYDKVSRMFWKNPPMLKYLCHQAVYDQRTLLKDHYPKVLPKLLTESVDDFIKTKEAKQDYDDCL